MSKSVKVLGGFLTGLEEHRRFLGQIHYIDQDRNQKSVISDHFSVITYKAH